MTPHLIDLDLNFLMIKNYGPKNLPPGCNLGPKFSPHAGHFSNIFWQHNYPLVKIVHALGCCDCDAWRGYNDLFLSHSFQIWIPPQKTNNENSIRFHSAVGKTIHFRVVQDNRFIVCIKNRQSIGEKMYYADFSQSSFISFVFEAYIYKINWIS